jgi:hypothetical protein
MFSAAAKSAATSIARCKAKWNLQPGPDPLARDHRRQIVYIARDQGTPHSVYPLPPTAMPLGIRPINDFAFKKTFGTPENRLALISLLNSIIERKSPIVDVTLENPLKV